MRKPGPQWWIKIADFGISKRVEEAMEGQDTEGMGTPYFASPEQQFRGALCCTHTSDIWSTGIIAFNLLTGEVPFSDTDRAMPLLRRYWNGKSKLPYQMLRARKTSNDGLQFIGLLLAADPEKRPAAQDCLNHSWVGPNLDADSELRYAVGIMIAAYLVANTCTVRWRRRRPKSQKTGRRSLRRPKAFL